MVELACSFGFGARNGRESCGDLSSRQARECSGGEESVDGGGDGRVDIRADLPAIVLLLDGRIVESLRSLMMGPPRAKPARKRRKDGLSGSVSKGSRALSALSCAKMKASP